MIGLPRFLRLLLAAALVGGAGVSTVAQDGKPHKRKDPKRAAKRGALLLRAFDKDKDGALSRDEYPAGFPAKFDRLDADGDGRLVAAELATLTGEGPPERDGRRGRWVRVMRTLDTDQDGQVSHEEWKASRRPLPDSMFTRLDSNIDGVLSEDEWRAGARRMGGTWRGRAASSLVRRFDKDADGKISRDEWPSRAEVFAKFDVDGDGFLTLQELSPQGPRSVTFGLDTDRRAAGWMKRFDKDADDKISAKEFGNERRFKEFDTDGDGFLTSEELRETFNKRMREREYDVVERFDRNGDGKVTQAEYTGPAGRFRKLDTNGDGAIDRSDR